MNEKLYIESATTTLQRYTRICAIIEKMELSLLDSEYNDNTEYFILDDGQSKITRAFRNPVEITKALQHYDTVKTRLFNQLNGGGAVVLRDVQRLAR